jgi:hypothetical protein
MWLDDLSGMKRRIAILWRVDCRAAGKFGDRKFVGSGVRQIRSGCGPGYRTFSRQGNPELRNMTALLGTLGLRLVVQPIRRCASAPFHSVLVAGGRPDFLRGRSCAAVLFGFLATAAGIGIVPANFEFGRDRC